MSLKQKNNKLLGGHHDRQLLIFNLADFYTTFLKSIPYQQYPAIAVFLWGYRGFMGYVLPEQTLMEAQK